MDPPNPLQYSYCDKEYQFISQDTSYIEKYLCSICIQVLFEPVQTSCGHLFCDNCLKKWQKATCPTCKTTFTEPALIDNFNNRQIKNLTVLCPNSVQGCEWKGQLGSLEAHQEDDCAHQLVHCPAKCGKKLERRQLEKHHEDHCELREYKCPYCQEDSNSGLRCTMPKGTYKDVTTEHFKACGNYPVDCPNTCDTQGLVRRHLASHLATCPEQVIPCRYQTLGCKVQLARREMDKHIADKNFHLDTAMVTTNDLVKTVATLQQQVSVLLELNGVQLPLSPAPHHPAKPWLEVDQGPLYPPFTVKMESSTGTDTDSPQFMSQPGGYRLAMRLKCNVIGKKYLQLFPVDCPENHSLKWPVSITMKCVLLNQNEDKGHTEFKLEETLQHQDDNKYSHPHEVLQYTCSQPSLLEHEHYIKVLEVVVHNKPK